MKRARPAAVLVVLAILVTGSLDARVVPRAEFGRPLEVEGKVIHGVGQTTLIEYAGVAQHLAPDHLPAFTMAYIGVKFSLESIDERFDRWQSWFDQLPADVGLNLGLSFTQDGKGKAAEYAEDILAGKYDRNLKRLATRIRDLGRPVWVRIGYECNGFWNGYQPESYRRAYRHIAGILREHGGNQMATIWCVHPINGLQRIMKFYPGDDWVDWWSIDLFQLNLLERPVVRAYCQEALKHGRPVLIGESTPAEVPRDQQWQKWFVPFFDLIASEPAIKAFSYINRNWNASGWDWGDCRLQVSPQLLSQYQQAVSGLLFHHATKPAPAILEVVQVEIDAEPSGDHGRFRLRDQESLRLTLPDATKPRLAILTLVYELRDKNGKVAPDAEATLEIRDRVSNALVVSHACRARERPRQVDLPLPIEVLGQDLEITVKTPSGTDFLLDSPNTPGGLPPQLTICTEPQEPIRTRPQPAP